MDRSINLFKSRQWSDEASKLAACPHLKTKQELLEELNEFGVWWVIDKSTKEELVEAYMENLAALPQKKLDSSRLQRAKRLQLENKPVVCQLSSTTKRKLMPDEKRPLTTDETVNPGHPKKIKRIVF